MKKGILNILREVVSFALIVLVLSTALVCNIISADSNYLENLGRKIDQEQLLLMIDFSDVEIKKGGTITPTPIQIENNASYSITYLDAIDYYGTKLSLRIDVSTPSDGIKNLNDGVFAARNIIKLDDNNRVDLYLNATTKKGTNPYEDGYEGFGDNATDANVTFTFLNSDNEPTGFTGLIGLEDIDGSDYLFNTSGRTIYYIDAAGDDSSGHPNPGKLASKHFLVESSGLIRDRNPGDGDKVGSYDYAQIFIPLNNESTFSFGFNSRSDEIFMPMIYTWKYRINYDSNAEDATGTMDSDTFTNADNKMLSKNNEFERPGYRFIGFTVDEAEYDPETSILITEPTDFKETLINKGAFGEITLYAQWEPAYTIKYLKNATDATGQMKDNVYTSDDATMPSEKEWKFERPGYEFVGFKLENEGPVIGLNSEGNYSRDYKDVLLEEEDRVINLYAQWNPLPFKIKYDANGGSGEMPDNDYLGSDETMPSADTWTFEKDGYNFVGYKVENTGDTLTPVSRDYKEILLKEKDGIITLYAQWEPIKYNVVFDPNEPVEGSVKGEMKDHIGILFDTTYSLNKNVYTAEGYSWVGWNLEPDRSGRAFTDEEKFKNLTNVNNDTVTLYAQWEPWKYTIRYDGNGGVGNMPDQTFYFTDPTFMSNKNLFDRDGYRYMGFEYTDKAGNKYIIATPADFRKLLVDMGPNSVLTLVALWEKTASMDLDATYVETPYRIPITGID